MLDNILTLTKQLITIPSTEHNPSELSRILEVVKKEINGDFTMEDFKSNGIKSILVHNAKPGTKHFKIILNAHLDVVPGEPHQFNPVEKDGRLYGRGAYDMKAAAVIMILVFKELAAKVTYPLALQIVTDEEAGSDNGIKYQLKKGVRADFVISGECGSNMQIGNQAKGLFWCRIHTQGTASHGAYLWRGNNALWTLQDTLSVLRKKYPVPENEQWITTMNLAKIDTPNNVPNKVPDEASAYLDFRFIEEEKETIISDIKKLLPKSVAMDIVAFDPPMFTDEKNPYIKSLLDSIKSVTDKKGEFYAAHATSEIRFYNEVGCDGVEFGVVGGQQHTNEEWVDIKKLEAYYQTLYQFLLNAQKV